ncbi:DBH-like monooxygenase protein 1 [Folsomia candida]|uniref:DBH-like monooxygenase protein 1 n=1 Tax=Folsomia candida TaxID=158441 RepID=A0A226D948_FOLCA|nr:DBH-like monooxygenase protein 1 [Folsomia candida]
MLPFQKFKFFFSAIICLILVENYCPVFGHKLDLSDDVSVTWNSTDPVWLTMEMTVVGGGYVAVGFSPQGAMTGADMVLGWVDKDGVPHLMDLYGIGNTRPRHDERQDYELLYGSETDGKTTIRFRRKWDTCDTAHDMAITNDTIRLIWAMSEEDPVYDLHPNGTLLKFYPKYHGAERRGVKRVYLRNSAHHVPFPDAPGENEDNSVKFFDMKMDNNLIDREDDIYFCKIAKFPTLETKHHLFGYRPILQPGNERSIHHIIMYQCVVGPTDENMPHSDGTDAVFRKFVDHPGGRCYTPNMPPEWGQYCTSIPILWTAGSEGNIFPPIAGNPLEEGGSVYFMFEIHYDNPSLSTFNDSSGFRLFYTSNLRQHDSDVILVGEKISPFHVVPHGMESFTTAAHCTAECTQQTIPSTGINVTTVLLHTHLSGRKIVLKHIRNGVELAPIALENNYDFNYQQVRVVDPPRLLLPGDELITECEYNTVGKNSPAFGGLGTRDEMCMAFVYYYPRIPLSECKTQLEFYSFLNPLGIINVTGDILNEMEMPYAPRENQSTQYPDNPFYLKNSTYDKPLNALDVILISQPEPTLANTVGGVIRNLNWTKDGSAIEKGWISGKRYAFCTGQRKHHIPLKVLKN